MHLWIAICSQKVPITYQDQRLLPKKYSLNTQKMNRQTHTKLGLLTFHFSDNYGALLQAYGLRTWLCQQGLIVDFINYHPPHVEAGGRLIFSLSARATKANLKSIFLTLTHLRQRLLGDRIQAQRFDSFRRDKLALHGPILHAASDVDVFLNRPEGKFDLILCGSDQIWAPSEQFGVDPVYFLHFPSGAQGARRSSYAPSFGRPHLDPEHETIVGPWLSKLDGLSAREQSGVEMAKRLSGKPVSWVPDPTILLGDFSDLAREGATEFGTDHVFCYALRTGDGIRNVAKHASAQLGAPILSPYNAHRRWREIGKTVYPSPAGWVAGLAQARFVVTNSFHGTVFSILFRKPFLTVALPGSRTGMNERSKSLLTALGLEHRLVDGTDAASVDQSFATPIDWERVTPKLSQMQNAGREYLRTQIAAVG